MATASMTVMTAAELREMMNIRREIDGMFKTCQGYVKDELDDITRKEDKEKKEKIEEMKDTKGKVEAYLKNFKLKKPPPVLQSQGSASKGKGKVNCDYQLKRKSPDMDMKLEKILEEASINSKEEEFNGLRWQLKMCLLCFSIFPMDADIVKRVLIYWWIGEGFVTAKGEKTAEEVGEECSQQLVELEFIQPVYNKRRGNILRCRMDPWIRRMIIKLSRNEQFFNLIESGMPSSSPSKSGHAYLISEDEDGQLDEAYFLREAKRSLRTLFNVNVTFLKLNFDVNSLPKLKSLVVLHLGNWRASDTDSIHFIKIEETQTLDMLGDLVNLRYLSLRGISVITKLPSSIKALRNLEILDLKGCHNLEKLTNEIKWLKKLTHLDVSECPVLEYLPKELGSLSELQVIKGFMFGSYRSLDSCKVADLAILKKLRKLSINIWHETSAYEVDLHELYKIKGLRAIAITWSASAFTKISFPPSIVKLDLRCFPDSDPLPSFNSMHLVNLEKLYIRGGKMAKRHFGETSWKIKMLRLKFLKEMKLENIDIQALFPQLEYLEVYECENIKLSDESYQLDSDGVWVKEALDGSTTVTPASAAATTTPEAPPASAAPTTTIQEAPLASAAPTINPEAPPASIAPATTPEVSSASAAPTTTPEAAPATTAPTTTPEAASASATSTTSTPETAPASAAPTTTPEAPRASAVPTPIPEASPTSAAPTTITKDPPASPTPTTTQEASPASTPPTSTAEASSTTTASAAPATTPEASAASAALATTPEASPASAAPTTTAEASSTSTAPTTTPDAPTAFPAPATTPEASPASAALTTTPEASLASATPEAPPASAARTTTQASPASAAPTTT